MLAVVVRDGRVVLALMACLVGCDPSVDATHPHDPSTPVELQAPGAVTVVVSMDEGPIDVAGRDGPRVELRPTEGGEAGGWIEPGRVECLDAPDGHCLRQRLTFGPLVPGRYRLVTGGEAVDPVGVFEREVTVELGDTLELAPVVLPRRKATIVASLRPMDGAVLPSLEAETLAIETHYPGGRIHRLAWRSFAGVGQGEADARGVAVELSSVPVGAPLTLRVIARGFAPAAQPIEVRADGRVIAAGEQTPTRVLPVELTRSDAVVTVGPTGMAATRSPSLEVRIDPGAIGATHAVVRVPGEARYRSTCEAPIQIAGGEPPGWDPDRRAELEAALPLDEEAWSRVEWSGVVVLPAAVPGGGCDAIADGSHPVVVSLLAHDRVLDDFYFDIELDRVAIERFGVERVEPDGPVELDPADETLVHLGRDLPALHRLWADDRAPALSVEAAWDGGGAAALSDELEHPHPGRSVSPLDADRLWPPCGRGECEEPATWAVTAIDAAANRATEVFRVCYDDRRPSAEGLTLRQGGGARGVLAEGARLFRSADVSLVFDGGSDGVDRESGCTVGSPFDEPVPPLRDAEYVEITIRAGEAQIGPTRERLPREPSASGAMRLPLAGLEGQRLEVRVVAVDRAGNRSLQRALPLVIDTVAPEPPRLVATQRGPGGSTSSVEAPDPLFAGAWAPMGALAVRVEPAVGEDERDWGRQVCALSLDGEVVDEVEGVGGACHFTLDRAEAMQTRRYTVRARVYDRAGNESRWSAALPVVDDVEPPRIEALTLDPAPVPWLAEAGVDAERRVFAADEGVVMHVEVADDRVEDGVRVLWRVAGAGLDDDATVPGDVCTGSSGAWRVAEVRSPASEGGPGRVRWQTALEITEEGGDRDLLVVVCDRAGNSSATAAPGSERRVAVARRVERDGEAPRVVLRVAGAEGTRVERVPGGWRVGCLSGVVGPGSAGCGAAGGQSDGMPQAWVVVGLDVDDPDALSDPSVCAAGGGAPASGGWPIRVSTTLDERAPVAAILDAEASIHCVPLWPDAGLRAAADALHVDVAVDVEDAAGHIVSRQTTVELDAEPPLIVSAELHTDEGLFAFYQDDRWSSAPGVSSTADGSLRTRHRHFSLSLVATDGGERLAAPALEVTVDGASGALDPRLVQVEQQGDHVLRIVALDEAGNRSLPVTLGVRVDTEAPGFEVQFAADCEGRGARPAPRRGEGVALRPGQCLSVALDAAVDRDDPHRVVWRDGGGAVGGEGPIESGRAALPLEGLGEGSMTLTVEVSDATGNVGVRQIPVVVDGTGPVIDLAFPGQRWVGDESEGRGYWILDRHAPTAALTVVDASTSVERVEVSVTRSDGASRWSDDIESHGLPIALSGIDGDGRWTVRVEAVDAAGNMTASSVDVHVDTVPPEVWVGLRAHGDDADGGRLRWLDGGFIVGRGLELALVVHVDEAAGMPGEPDEEIEWLPRLAEPPAVVAGDERYDIEVEYPELEMGALSEKPAGRYSFSLEGLVAEPRVAWVRVIDRAGNETIEEVSIGRDDQPPRLDRITVGERTLLREGQSLEHPLVDGALLVPAAQQQVVAQGVDEAPAFGPVTVVYTLEPVGESDACPPRPSPDALDAWASGLRRGSLDTLIDLNEEAGELNEGAVAAGEDAGDLNDGAGAAGEDAGELNEGAVAAGELDEDAGAAGEDAGEPSLRLCLYPVDAAGNVGAVHTLVGGGDDEGSGVVLTLDDDRPEIAVRMRPATCGGEAEPACLSACAAEGVSLVPSAVGCRVGVSLGAVIEVDIDPVDDTPSRMCEGPHDPVERDCARVPDGTHVSIGLDGEEAVYDVELDGCQGPAVAGRVARLSLSALLGRDEATCQDPTGVPSTVTFYVTVTDLAGNTRTVERTIHPDLVAPSFQFTQVGEHALPGPRDAGCAGGAGSAVECPLRLRSQSPEVAFDLRRADGAAVDDDLQVAIWSSGEGTEDELLPPELVPRRHAFGAGGQGTPDVLYGRAVDAAGNASPVHAVHVVIDDTLPEFDLTVRTGGGGCGEVIPVGNTYLVNGESSITLAVDVYDEQGDVDAPLAQRCEAPVEPLDGGDGEAGAGEEGDADGGDEEGAAPVVPVCERWRSPPSRGAYTVNVIRLDTNDDFGGQTGRCSEIPDIDVSVGEGQRLPVVLQVTVTDSAGNVSRPRELRIWHDDHSPTIERLSFIDQGDACADPGETCLLPDRTPRVRLEYRDGEDAYPYEAPLLHVAYRDEPGCAVEEVLDEPPQPVTVGRLRLPDGDEGYICLVVVDAAGNRSEPYEQHFEIVPERALVLELDANADGRLSRAGDEHLVGCRLGTRPAGGGAGDCELTVDLRARFIGDGERGDMSISAARLIHTPPGGEPVALELDGIEGGVARFSTPRLTLGRHVFEVTLTDAVGREVSRAAHLWVDDRVPRVDAAVGPGAAARRIEGCQPVSTLHPPLVLTPPPAEPALDPLGLGRATRYAVLPVDVSDDPCPLDVDVTALVPPSALPLFDRPGRQAWCVYEQDGVGNVGASERLCVVYNDRGPRVALGLYDPETEGRVEGDLTAQSGAVVTRGLRLLVRVEDPERDWDDAQFRVCEPGTLDDCERLGEVPGVEGVAIDLPLFGEDGLIGGERGLVTVRRVVLDDSGQSTPVAARLWYDDAKPGPVRVEAFDGECRADRDGEGEGEAYIRTALSAPRLMVTVCDRIDMNGDEGCGAGDPLNFAEVCFGDACGDAGAWTRIPVNTPTPVPVRLGADAAERSSHRVYARDRGGNPEDLEAEVEVAGCVTGQAVTIVVDDDPPAFEVGVASPIVRRAADLEVLLSEVEVDEIEIGIASAPCGETFVVDGGVLVTRGGEPIAQGEGGVTHLTPDDFGCGDIPDADFVRVDIEGIKRLDGRQQTVSRRVLVEIDDDPPRLWPDQIRTTSLGEDPLIEFDGRRWGPGEGFRVSLSDQDSEFRFDHDLVGFYLVDGCAIPDRPAPPDCPAEGGDLLPRDDEGRERAYGCFSVIPRDARGNCGRPVEIDAAPIEPFAGDGPLGGVTVEFDPVGDPLAGHADFVEVPDVDPSDGEGDDPGWVLVTDQARLTARLRDVPPYLDAWWIGPGGPVDLDDPAGDPIPIREPIEVVLLADGEGDDPRPIPVILQVTVTDVFGGSHAHVFDAVVEAERDAP